MAAINRPNTALVSLSFAASVLLFAGAHAQTPNYDAGYMSIVDAAKREGKITIYSSTDLAQARGLIEAFRSAYPAISVDYQELGTNQIYNRVISEAAAKQDAADVVWSSAMDQQINLVVNGYAASYKSPEAGKLPSWAIFRDQAFATTVEPIAVVFNKRLLPPDWVPNSYSQTVTLLREKRDALKGKVSGGDPEKSGTVFMLMWNDARERSDFWEMQEAFGAAQGQVLTGSGSLREKVVSGEHLLGLGALAPYALQWAKDNPTIGVAFLQDYTPAFERVAVINKAAPHPNAARVFLDFMISRQGQEAIASGGLPSLRSDTSVGENMESVNKLVGGNLKPIPLNESLLDIQDQQKRVQFVQRWRKAMQR